MDYGKEFQKYATKHLGISSLRVDEYTKLVSQSGGIYGLTPNIIEERQMNASVIDIFSRLMMDRIIFLGVPIYEDVANIIMGQLLFLESANPNRDIQIYINSPGGSVYAGLAIYDTMQYISSDVATICTGMAASMGAILLCAGVEGKRAEAIIDGLALVDFDAERVMLGGCPDHVGAGIDRRMPRAATVDESPRAFGPGALAIHNKVSPPGSRCVWAETPKHRKRDRSYR